MKKRLFQILIVCFCLLIPLSCFTVLADQIQIDPQFSSQGYNSLIGFTDMISGNCLESQYTYGGLYNPLILACGSEVRWVEGLAAVRYDLGKEFPAGTTFQISCGGWYNKNYSFTSVNMYASSVCPVSEDSYWEFVASRSALDPVSGEGAILTTNGQYKARLYNGSYTLPLKSRYIYLVFDIYLSSVRNGGVYLGVSCGSISYTANVGDTITQNTNNILSRLGSFFSSVVSFFKNIGKFLSSVIADTLKQLYLFAAVYAFFAQLLWQIPPIIQVTFSAVISVTILYLILGRQQGG